MGGDIDGEATGDYSGESVNISADGTKVAIGATSNDGNGSNSGHVRVYQIDFDSITLTSLTISASELITLDSQFSGTVNASSVTTINGTFADINTVYIAGNAGTIAGLGNEAITVTDASITVAQANTLAAQTTGVVTATISHGAIATLTGLTETGNAYTITVTDASVAAAALNTLNAKTTGVITVQATTITGTAADINTAYTSNAAGTITGLGNEAVTITDTSIDASILITLDGFTSGIINASSITTLTGSASDQAIVRASSGITGLPGGIALNSITLTSQASLQVN